MYLVLYLVFSPKLSYLRTMASDAKRLAAVFRDIFHPKSDPVSVINEGNSKYSKGYLSSVQGYAIDWSEMDAGLPTEITIKRPSSKNQVSTYRRTHPNTTPEELKLQREELLKQDALLHNVECAAYTLLEGSPIQMKIPKIYLTRKATATGNGMIVMDDLSGRGAVSKLYSEATLEQAKEIAEQVGRLQAMSFQSEQKTSELTLPVKTLEMFMEFAESAVNSIVSEFSDIFPFAEHEVLNLCDKDALIETAQAQRMLLAHGDMWSNNILWNKQSGMLEGIIDWQFLHFGHPVRDLFRFTTSSVSPELRRKHFAELLKHQYGTFCDFAKTNANPSAVGIPDFNAYTANCSIEMKFATVLYLIQVGLLINDVLKDSENWMRETLVKRAAACVHDVMRGYDFWKE